SGGTSHYRYWEPPRCIAMNGAVRILDSLTQGSITPNARTVSRDVVSRSRLNHRRCQSDHPRPRAWQMRLLRRINNNCQSQFLDFKTDMLEEIATSRFMSRGARHAAGRIAGYR